jgi:hypothetical protein
LNTSLYKQLVSNLKTRMDNWDESAFLEYSDIIKLAKKYNIK